VRALVLLALVAAGCGPAEPCAGWHDTLGGDAGLLLTQAEHGLAWGQTACFQCHQAWTIHPAECVDEAWLDHLDEAVDFEDSHSCTGCHGMNGTTEDDWVDTTSSAS
jgi:hypothetical protein